MARSQRLQAEEKQRPGLAASERSSEGGDTPASSYAPLQAAADVDLMEGQSASSFETSASRQDIFTRQSFHDGDSMHLQPDHRFRHQHQRSMNNQLHADSRRIPQQKHVIRAEGMRPHDATMGQEHRGQQHAAGDQQKAIMSEYGHRQDGTYNLDSARDSMLGPRLRPETPSPPHEAVPWHARNRPFENGVHGWFQQSTPVGRSHQQQQLQLQGEVQPQQSQQQQHLQRQQSLPVGDRSLALVPVAEPGPLSYSSAPAAVQHSRHLMTVPAPANNTLTNFDGSSGYRPLRTPQQALQQEQARHDVTRMALQVAQHQLEGLKHRCQERSELLAEAQEHSHAAQRDADELRASLHQQQPQQAAPNAANAEEIKRLEQALGQAQHEQNRYESELQSLRQEKNLMELEAAEKADEVEDMTLKLERVQSANAALHQQAQQIRLQIAASSKAAQAAESQLQQSVGVEGEALVLDIRQQLEQSQQQQEALAAELQHSQSSFQQLRQSVEHERAGMQHEAKLRKQLRQSVRLMRSIQGQNVDSTDMDTISDTASKSGSLLSSGADAVLGAYIEQGGAITGVGHDDIHGRCQQLERALQQAQEELAAEQDRQRQLQQDLSAVDEATLLSDDILDSNSGALQDVANIKHLARSYILLRHQHDELAEDLGRALDVGQRALADKELVASEKVAVTRDYASLRRKMDAAESELERLQGLEAVAKEAMAALEAEHREVQRLQHELESSTSSQTEQKGQVQQLQDSLKAVREMSEAHQHAHEDLQQRLRSVKAEQSQLQVKLRQRELDLETQTSLLHERDQEIQTNRDQHLQAQRDWLAQAAKSRDMMRRMEGELKSCQRTLRQRTARLEELDVSVGSPAVRRQASPSKRPGLTDSLFMTGLCEEWLVNPSATPPPTPDPAAPSRHAFQLSPATPTLANSARPQKASSILDTGGSRTFEEGSRLDLLGELDTEQVRDLNQDFLGASTNSTRKGAASQPGSSQGRSSGGSRLRAAADNRDSSVDNATPVPWPVPPGSSGAAALRELEKANGPGNLRDPAGIFVSSDDMNLPEGDYVFISVGGEQRLPAEKVTSASIACQWAQVSEQLDGALYEQLAVTDEFSCVKDFGKFWKAEEENLAQVQLNLLPCIHLAYRGFKKEVDSKDQYKHVRLIAEFKPFSSYSEGEYEEGVGEIICRCRCALNVGRDPFVLPALVTDNRYIRAYLVRDSKHAALQHIWKAKRLPLCVERGTAHLSNPLPLDTSSDGFKELAFLLWLGEALILKAEAEHQDLWLRPGQQVHVKSSQGRHFASAQIKAVLQQRTCFSATYCARCSRTGLAVVVKLGPLPEHRSQAGLLQLDRGAWDQVLGPIILR
ncbi:hypothetical protein WJX74_003430 [Apatococcus lobatus]|uniref:Uncharacterized protein n=1 Tax=Apatococcus lobatus TaxID=904363 RepID=A0AAW1QUW4_9CHLO